MKIKNFLKTKKGSVITIGPDESVQATIQKLVEHNIGALPVCDDKGVVLGIVSERDLLKECSQRVSGIAATKVEDIMTREVAIGTGDDDINYTMDIMTQMKIRHLPIMKDLKLVGMISARDIVENQLEESKAQIRYLSDYTELLTAILHEQRANAEE